MMVVTVTVFVTVVMVLVTVMLFPVAVVMVVVVMRVADFSGPADARQRLSQNLVVGGHVRGGFLQEIGRTFRLSRPRRRGPLPEFGHVTPVVLDPVR